MPDYVYLVTDTRFDRRDIHSVWSRKEDAEAVRQSIKWTHVEQWAVNTVQPDTADAWLGIVQSRQQSLTEPIMPELTDDELAKLLGAYQ